MSSFARRAPYFSRSTQSLATSVFVMALSGVLLCGALWMPCTAKESDKSSDTSTEEKESDEKSTKSARKKTEKAEKPATSPQLHIGSSQEAIRAIEELPLPQGAAISTPSKTPTPKVAPTPVASTKPNLTTKATRAELPYLSSEEEPEIAAKFSTKPTPKVTTSVNDELEDEADEETAKPGGILAPAPLKGFPTFPSPVRKSTTPPKVNVPVWEDDETSTTTLPEKPEAPVFDGNDAAQMRVGGAIARGEILQNAGALTLELSARNTGTSTWRGDDEAPVRVVVRWFDQNTKRRARWEIKWLRDEIAPGETLSMRPQVQVPRAGKFTVVVSLLRLGSLRFSPPANDNAELKLPGEFARNVFSLEVRPSSPLTEGLGGAEEHLETTENTSANKASPR